MIPTWQETLLNVDPQAPNIHEIKQNAIAQEIAALRAEIAAMREQKPVAFAMLRDDGLVLDVICPDEHESHEGSYTLPLYTAPGAKE